MITKIVHANGGRTCVHEGGRITNLGEYYCKAKDAKPIEGVNNADLCVIMDWNLLSTEEQAACGAQVWIFDAADRKWCPL